MRVHLRTSMLLLMLALMLLLAGGAAIPTRVRASGDAQAQAQAQAQAAVQASPKVIVEHAGLSVQLTEGAIVYDGVVAIPLRLLAEALGGTVQWIDATREAVFTAYRTVAIFSVAAGKVTVNGATHQLSSGVVLRDGRLVVALADLDHLGLGYSVEPDASVIKVFRKRVTVSVSADTLHGRPRMVISGDRELNYTAFTLKAPDRVVVDVYDAVIAGDVAPIAVGVGGVSRVRAAMNRPGVVRVVADLDGPAGYSVTTIEADAEGKARVEVLFNSRVTGIGLDEASAISRLLVAASSPIEPTLSEDPESDVTIVEIGHADLEANMAGVELVGRSITLVRAQQSAQAGATGATGVRLQVSREPGTKPILRSLSEDGSVWAVDFAHQIVASSMWEEPGSIVVEITGSGQAKPSVFKLRQPDRIALDFPGVWAAAPWAVTSKTGPGGVGLRFAQFNTDTARAVIDLPVEMAYTVENPDPHTVRVRLVTSPLLGKKIVLDPGHGGSDPGAVRDKVYEKDINLDVAQRLNTLLLAAGASVVMTRAGDQTVDLQSRTDLANRSGAEAFVSIHCNSSFDVFPGGTESFYFNLAPYSQELAVLVHTYLVRAIGLLDRKVRSRDLFVIRNTTIPAVLVEVAFLSNDYEFRKLGEADFRQKAAEGIFKGLEAYFRSDVYKRWPPVAATAAPTVTQPQGSPPAHETPSAAPTVEAPDAAAAAEPPSAEQPATEQPVIQLPATHEPEPSAADEPAPVDAPSEGSGDEHATPEPPAPPAPPTDELPAPAEAEFEAPMGEDGNPVSDS